MQIAKRTLMVAAIVLAVQAQAAISVYDISFSGVSSAASGQIDVAGGLATAGYLTVTAGPNQGTYNLASLTSSLITGGSPSVPSIRFTDGTDQIFDDLVNPSSNPFLTGNGLEFANNNVVGFNLWGTGAGSYTLFDVSGPPLTSVYSEDSGTASIVAVPEPATMLPGLSALGYGLFSLRKRLLLAKAVQH
jgi:hypothetical protein